MNAAIFWRVVWKEYRQQRALWCAIALAGVIMQVGVIVYCMLNDAGGLADRLFTVALSVPVLYSLGCGAALFAGEHEAGTFSFQRSLPVAAGHVFTSKLLFAIVSALSLFPVLWLVAWALSSWELPDNRWHLKLWGGGIIATVEVLFWAALGSLLLRRVLPAAIVSGLIAVLLGYSSLVLVMAFGGLFQEQVDEYFSTLPMRSLCALFALAVAVQLGKRWFDENPKLFSATPSVATASVARSSRVSTGGVVLRRLIWHEWRQSRVTMFWLGAGYFCLAIWFGFFLQAPGKSQWEVMFVLLPVLATAAGACMFWADQQGQSYHYFAEHAVRPRLVWLSRQFAWGLPILMIAGIACAPLLSGWWPDEEELAGAGIGFAVLMFASGQACSMFIRSGIVAIFSAVLCSIMLFFWAILLQKMGVWWVVSTLPLPLIFWWGTWLYSPKWIQQRSSWRVRLAAAASIVVPLCAVVVAIAAYRAYEIPAIQTSFNAAEVVIEEPIDPDAAETAEMYAEAVGLLRNKVNVDAAGVTRITRDDDWERGIELFVAASQRESCYFPNWDDLPHTGFFDAQPLARAAVAEAKERLATGDLDAAAELYEALLRLASHYYQQQASMTYAVHTQAVENVLWTELAPWAAHPEQSRESVLAMLDRIREFSAESKPDWEREVYLYHALIRRFAGLDDEVLTNYIGLERPGRTILKLVYRLMPWERARILRLLDIHTESELHMIARAPSLPPSQLWPQMTTAHGPEFVLTHRNGSRMVISKDDQFRRWLKTTPWFMLGYYEGNYRVQSDTRDMPRRAVQVQLALIAWQMEHGELPEYLELLVGSGLEDLPVDPYTGRPFVYVREGTEEEVWEPIPEDEVEAEVEADDMGEMSMESMMGSGMGSAMRTKLVPTDPFIWSPGLQIYYTHGINRGPTGSPVATDFRHSGRAGQQLKGDRELLECGLRFYIPQVANSLHRDEPSED